MKTLTTINWVLVGLYGLVILYLLFANNGPNNDAAGRSMLSGFIFVLLVFVGGLVFLNMRDSRAAKITMTVLGGVPLLLISTNLIVEAQAEKRREKEDALQAATAIPVTDEDLAKQRVEDFLIWYKDNLPYISQIDLVDQEPGKPYAVNARNADRYLTYLRSSEMLTDHFVDEWNTFFKERQEGFELTHQTEGIPTGFDYDLVMLTLTQDVAKQMDSLNTLKINSVDINKDNASVKLFLVEDYEFKLVKQYNSWFIDEILNLSAE
ncbi:hypothetical protein GCM10028805_04330 [Spirosoma harenae]